MPFVDPPNDVEELNASSQSNHSLDYNMHQGVTNADIGGAGGDRFVDERLLGGL